GATGAGGMVSTGAAGAPATGGTTGAGGAIGTGGTAGGSALPDVVVYRVGDGTTTALSANGSPVFLDELSPTGALVRSIPMPTATNGTTQTHRLIASGVASSEGLLSRSSDGRYVVLTGYDAPLGGSTSLSGTTSATVPRTIARVDAAGNVDTTTGLTNAASGNNPRSAASTDGTNLWITGGAGGISYATLGASTGLQLSTTVTNLRQVGIFGAQLYVSTSSGSAVRIGTVGSGLPTTAGQTIANLPNFPTSGSPYAFFLADLDGAAGVDTLYVADDTTATGGLQKYSLVGGNWTSNGLVGSGTDAYRGVTGVVSGTTVTLFAVRGGGTAAAGGGQLVTLVDASGFNGAFAGTPTVLAAAITGTSFNTAFRGVALAPTP
ncbi:MAG TPA: DUF3616 domain-containing protein, partial [Polyangia bacterium]|nr:DUF3616 domain-containing protein [Polyangia bacterium]